MKNVFFGEGDKTTPIQNIELGDKVYDMGRHVIYYLALKKGYAFVQNRTFTQFEIIKDTMGRTQQIYLSREEIIALYKFAMREDT